MAMDDDGLDVEADPRGMDLTVVVPAHNEAARLPRTIEALRAFAMCRPLRIEVVVVDDGSRDDTAGVARAAHGDFLLVRAVCLGANRGKGAAVKRGMEEARGRYVAFIDADLPYGLDGLDAAMARLAAGADVVIGARDLAASDRTVDYGPLRRLSGKIYSLLVNAWAVQGIPDTQCGFKCFRAGVARELFRRVTVPGFAFDVELLTLAQCWELRIERIPVRFTHSDDSRVRLVRDSVRMLVDLLRVRRRRARGRYRRPPGLTLD